MRTKKNLAAILALTLEDGEAVVMFDPEQTDPVAIAKSISKTGFEAKVKNKKG